MLHQASSPLAKQLVKKRGKRKNVGASSSGGVPRLGIYGKVESIGHEDESAQVGSAPFRESTHEGQRTTNTDTVWKRKKVGNTGFSQF